MLRRDLIKLVGKKIEGIENIECLIRALLEKHNAVTADTVDFPELREEYVICRDIERGQTIKLLLAERETFFILALQDTVKYKNSCCYSREVFYIYK